MWKRPSKQTGADGTTDKLLENPGAYLRMNLLCAYLAKELANKGVELRVSMTKALKGQMSICLAAKRYQEEVGLFSIHESDTHMLVPMVVLYSHSIM